MKHRVFTALLALFSSVATATSLEELQRPPEYQPLEGFIGSWTTLGREKHFHEVCSWYPGKFHVVCNAKSKRDDGSTGHSMSILSFVPASGYVYSGIGSQGRYETFENGRWSAGTFIFETRQIENNSPVISRITIGPFTTTGFLFVVHTSKDGISWTEAERTTYLKL